MLAYLMLVDENKNFAVILHKYLGQLIAKSGTSVKKKKTGIPSNCFVPADNHLFIRAIKLAVVISLFFLSLV